MRRSRVALIAGPLVAATLLLQGSAASATSSDGEDRTSVEATLRFHVVFSPFSYTDVGEPGVSAADVIVFHDRLSIGGRHRGDEVGSCVVVDPSGLSNCTGVVRLDDRGTITFAFANTPRPRKELAVTGGSDQYRGARGDGTLVEAGDGTGTLVLRITR